MELKYRCIKVLGSNDVTANIGRVMWDVNIGFVPRIQEMQSSGWHPEQLTHLEITAHCLREIHVGPFVNLEVLRLSRNEISALRKTGLTLLGRLRELDLSYNKLLELVELEPLRWLRSLRSLDVTGNLFNSKSVSDANKAHLRVLYVTRNLPGTNYCPGLVELNGHPVLPGHKVAALKEYGSFHSADLERLRFRLALCYTVGHRQVRSPAYMAALVRLNVAGFGLAAVDFAGMPALEVLDVSRNRLTELTGLEALRGLRVLDVSGNEKLTPKEVLARLARCTTLEAFAYGDARKLDKAHDRVIAELLEHNHRLFLVNGTPLTVAERVELYVQGLANNNNNSNNSNNSNNGGNGGTAKTMNAEEADEYRFNLAVSMSLQKGRLRSYAPQDVKPQQTTAEKEAVGKLYLCNAGLTAAHCPIGAYQGLRKLSLRGNRLVTIVGYGLEALVRLEVLDLSNNRLEDRPELLAEAFALRMSALRAVRVCENPPLDKACGNRARSRIIACASALPSVDLLAQDFHLRVIDTPVTVDDVVGALSDAKRSIDECNVLRFRSALAFRSAWSGALDKNYRPVPIVVFPCDRQVLKRITYLNLQSCKLCVLPLRGLSELCHLVADNNCIENGEAFGDLRGVPLDKLRTLDLRRNRIYKAELFAHFVAEHFPKLRALGLAGNPCVGSGPRAAADYRRRVLAAFAQKYADEPGYYLHNIDDTPITFEEVAQAANFNEVTLMNAAVGFSVRPYTVKMPRGCAVQELDLAGCGLARLALGKVSVVNLSGITRLSLEGNALDDKAILDSGLLKLTNITALDISANRIVNRETVRIILKKLIRVSRLWVSPNPCVGYNSDARKREETIAFIKKSAAIKNIVIDEGVLV